MITRSELQNLLKDCTKLLTIAEQLDSDKESGSMSFVTKNLFKGIRKIIIANELSENNTVCVSGLQGVGKSTMLKNLYDLSDEAMNISIGRGEKLPILIKESSDLNDVEMYSISMEKKNEKAIIKQINNFLA